MSDPVQLELLDKPKLLKLDFGCGKNPREGFDGVDALDFGQKHLFDLNNDWPFNDNSVEEAHASHFIEHLDAKNRIHFVNELYRVLIPLGKCQIIVPHWSSSRAYGDLTHQWPPVSEFWFYYLNREWRNGKTCSTCDFCQRNQHKICSVHKRDSPFSCTTCTPGNAPHNTEYICDFDSTWGYGMHQSIIPRNQEYQMFAMTFYKEACQDLLATITKREDK